ncbi:hypothetical protein AA464_08535 [Salmonella enterica subsp. enterica serovar Newport]|nr:hypothetical protein [Salmonella enterica subsp. enterica serovar Newport]
MFKKITSYMASKYQQVKAFAKGHARTFAASVTVAALTVPGVALAVAPTDPAEFFNQSMLDAIKVPILTAMGMIVATAFSILAFRMVATVGFGMVKSFFSSASR